MLEASLFRAEAVLRLEGMRGPWSNDYSKQQMSTPPPSPPHPSCNSPNTSRRLALDPSDVCLVGENPKCSVSALSRCEGL